MDALYFWNMFYDLKYFGLLILLMVGCKQGKRFHDENGIKTSDDPAIAAILQFQNDLNKVFRDPESSPLPDKYRKDFMGLDFFAPDTSYIINAQFKRTPDAKPILMPTTTERKTYQILYGVASFELHGQSHELEVYRDLATATNVLRKNDLFLPFYDETNGKETYGGGRYIDLKIPEKDVLEIDFNRAYNPYCVYNKKYSCPLVPRQNVLRTNVRAGAKDFYKN